MPWSFSQLACTPAFLVQRVLIMFSVEMTKGWCWLHSGPAGIGQFPTESRRLCTILAHGLDKSNE
jgi:hypothetical protein